MTQNSANTNAPVATVVDRARDHAQKGQFEAAIKLLDSSGESYEQDVDALYVYAVCYRCTNKRQEALITLNKLLAVNPEHSRAYQEIGHNHIAAGNTKKAIEGFGAAVELNSALLASWQALEKLHAKSGDRTAAAHASDQVKQLQQLPQPLQAVKSYINEGKIEIADQICRQFLQSNKKHVEGLRLLAEIASQARIIDDAEFILESAIAFEPKHVGARVDYAAILLKRQRFGIAHEVSQSLCRDFPGNKQFKALLGATTLGIGDTKEATRIFSELEAEEYGLQHTLLSLGHAHKTAGNLEEAIASYKRLYAFKPDYGDAFWSLANTKTYKFTESELAHMRDYEARPHTRAEDRVHFCFALGKAYEDSAQYETSMKFYERGNALNKDILNYESPEIQKRVERQKSVCTPQLFSERSNVGCDSPDPIFIVGLPRAGSTLLEQILASHSRVDGTLELPNILSLTRRLRGRQPADKTIEPQYPRILAEIDHDYFRQFGEQYLRDTQVYRQGAPFFIDKMPNNFLHIGLIKLILPNAKVIDARRHPMACCFSGFKQLFAEGQEFSYGLKEIGHYYKNYVDVMDHWDEVLPGFVLRVQHEDVVSDLEPQVRRMLAFCNLEFEEACVEFHKTERNVRTPSSEQVRQPIYSTGLEQWRHFEKHLNPLKEALGEQVLARYPIY